MKQEIDGYIAKYGDQNSPPPWQVFTIANDIRDGNLHLIQKVFDGAFEVGRIVDRFLTPANLKSSLTSYTHQTLRRTR